MPILFRWRRYYFFVANWILSITLQLNTPNFYEMEYLEPFFGDYNLTKVCCRDSYDYMSHIWSVFIVSVWKKRRRICMRLVRPHILDFNALYLKRHQRNSKVFAYKHRHPFLLFIEIIWVTGNPGPQLTIRTMFLYL